MQRKFQHGGALPIAFLAALAAASGCATPKKPERVVWPFPPEKARIEYVRTLKGPADVESGIQRFWTSVSGKRPLKVFNPTALALSDDGKRLYVSCSSIGLVLYFDFAKGVLERAADVEGHRPDRPYGLAVDGQGNLYVGDQAAQLVWMYSASGKFLRQIGRGMLDRPAGLAFDRKRQLLYVVDGSNGNSTRHRVLVFAPDGRLLRTIGTRGLNPGEFNFPSFITVGPDGKVYVADTLNFRIQVFDAEGAFLTMLGQIGEGPGQFGKAKGIAFDSFGDLYVVDGQLGIVQMFSPGFRPLMAFGGVARREELMQVPNDIAIDSQNNIYVSDFGFDHVNQYRLINTTAEETLAADVGAAGAPAPKSETTSQPASAAPATSPGGPPR